MDTWIDYSISEDSSSIIELKIREDKINEIGDRYEFKLKHNLKQSEMTKECAIWIKDKVEVKDYDI